MQLLGSIDFRAVEWTLLSCGSTRVSSAGGLDGLERVAEGKAVGTANEHELALVGVAGLHQVTQWVRIAAALLNAV